MGTVSTDVDGLDIIEDIIPVFSMKGSGRGNLEIDVWNAQKTNIISGFDERIGNWL